jgi:C4-dicarboxylate transporter, DctM subunit
MSHEIQGIIAVAILLIGLFIGMPVALAILVAGFVGMSLVVGPQSAIGFVSIDIFSTFSSYPLSAILMFVLMGFYAEMTGMTNRFFRIAYVWVGWIRGGLAVATVASCALFAAVCGSSAATVATVGKVAYPEMKKHSYDDSLATGCIAGAGTLGPLIPPSTGLVIYALLAEQSIAQMLVSGIIPGILLAIIMGVTVYFICWRNPKLGPPGPPTTWKEKTEVLPGLIEAAGLFVFVIGGLFFGLFTPTQAGSAGCIGAILIGLAHRTITWKKLWNATKAGLKVSCMIFFLITGSVVFGHFLSMSTLSIAFVDWAKALPIPPIGLFLLLALFYIVAGCVVDAMGLLVLSIPIIIPVFFELGFDPIWFGLMVNIITETGVITPPVGVNVYVMKAIVPDVPLQKIFAGVMPFLAAMLVCIALLILFPILVTWIPYLVH